MIRVPQDIILNTDLGDKRVIAFIAAISTQSLDVHSMVTFSGYFNDRHSGSVSRQYSGLLEYYFSAGHIVYNGWSVQPVLPNSNYAAISEYEVEQIISARKRGIVKSHDRMFLTLAYIRLRYIRDKQLPPFYSDLYHRIGKKIGLTEYSISKSVSYLVQLEVLAVKKLPRYSRRGTWHTGTTLFIEKADEGRASDMEQLLLDRIASLNREGT